MSLFSSIQLANNALRASQIGLQVVGQNIANANTPGYIREEVVLTPATTQQVGKLLFGLGVDVDAVVQKVDKFLQERLRNAASDRASGQVQEDTYAQLESLINELGDEDLSTTLGAFFGSIQEILNAPESLATRHLAILRGQTLADDIRRLYSRTLEIRRDLDDRVKKAADDINRLLKEIAALNVKIAKVEAGTTSNSDAVGLRDQRGKLLSDLAELIDIRVDEQEEGQANVSLNGIFLVSEGNYRQVKIVEESDNGFALSEVVLADTEEPIGQTSGRLAGLKIARDQIVGQFLDELDQFAATLIYEFNRVFSTGQGLQGYDEVESLFAVDDATVPLSQAGLPFAVESGSFQVMVYDEQTGLTETTDVTIDLLDPEQGTTLEQLAAALNAIDGVGAEVTDTRTLRIWAQSPTQQIAFAGDTSGVLAALGINVFFSGTGAGSIDVNDAVAQNAALFAASAGGVGADTQVAVELGGFLDRPLDSLQGKTIADAYEQMVANVTQGSSAARAVAEGYRVFEQTLEGQHLAISGVSLDEEAVKMLSFQRMFQAAARFIATINELLDVLVNL